MKTTFVLFALVFSQACVAGGVLRPIDISECLANDCMSRDVHVYSPEEKFKVQAWFDIVHFTEKNVTNFYPLFNVFNYTQKQVEVEIGMQLLDQDEKVLIEVIGKNTFDPTQNTEGSYETYFSVFAKPISSAIIKDTRYVRVVFKR